MGCTSLAAATALKRRADGRLCIDIDDTWLQGKGAYGGVVSAILARAAIATVDPRRRLRSLTTAFCAPARPGSYDISVERVREGARVSTLALRLTDAAGATTATALATMAAPRVSDEIKSAATLMTRVLPPRPAANDVEPLPPDVPLLPAFVRNFEWRMAGGDIPGSGGRAAVGAWLRLRDEPGPLAVDEAVAVALLDVLPPALLSALPRMVPAASVEWTVQLLTPLPVTLPPGAFTYVHAETHVAADGYAEELDTLWTEDGLLLGQARQTISIL